MTDKKGLLVTPLFMLLLGGGVVHVFDPFSEPVFLFRKPYSLVRGALSKVNQLINQESMMLMLKM